MTKKISLYGMLTALTVAVSLIVIIPIPGTNGFITLADTGIYIASLLFGPLGGLTVGAFSGGLIDLVSGYPQWFLFSLLIHGCQGWVAGMFFERKLKSQIVGLILGCLIMIVGYALATSLLYGTGAGLVSIPSNSVQSIFGAVVAVPLSQAIKKALPKGYLTKEGK